MKVKSVLIKLMIVFFVGVFVWAGYNYYTVTKTTNAEKEEITALADLAGVHEAETGDADAAAANSIHTLQAQNPDAFGWLTIADTRIDYPVMFTPDEPEKYLRRSFSGKDSVGGVPFLDGDTFPGCGNYIIYGHRMDNGTMFADLQNYREKEYFRAHRYITFTTAEGRRDYEIIAVFLAKKGGDFLYYTYVDLTNEDVFNEFIGNVKLQSLYDTGSTAVYGDQLLTLSTCSYHTTDGRLAVVAKQVRRDG